VLRSNVKKIMTVILAASLISTVAAGCSKPAATTTPGTQSANSGPKYPTKNLTFVAPSGAGGAFDLALRSITKILGDTKLVDQQMLVEDQPGGGGSQFLADYATKQIKNDYMMFLTSPTMLINNLKKEGNSPYSYGDTTPLAQFFVDYAVIAVKADSPYKDLKSLFEAMKQDPKKLSVAGGSAPGAVDHLSFLLPAFKYGIDPKQIKYVSYDGKAESMTALLGGNADVLTSVTASVSQYLEAGRIRVLAVNAPERRPGVFKDVPTLKELGIDADFSIWRGVFGPKNISAEAKAYWASTFEKLSKSPEWQAELKKNNWEPAYLGADDFKKSLDKQNTDLKDLLKALDMAK
jgi:putative tricarboxylic transport membrane protein